MLLLCGCHGNSHSSLQNMPLLRIHWTRAKIWWQHIYCGKSLVKGKYSLHRLQIYGPKEHLIKAADRRDGHGLHCDTIQNGKKHRWREGRIFPKRLHGRRRRQGQDQHCERRKRHTRKTQQARYKNSRWFFLAFKRHSRAISRKKSDSSATRVNLLVENECYFSLRPMTSEVGLWAFCFVSPIIKVSKLSFFFAILFIMRYCKDYSTLYWKRRSVNRHRSRCMPIKRPWDDERSQRALWTCLEAILFVVKYYNYSDYYYWVQHEKTNWKNQISKLNTTYAASKTDWWYYWTFFNCKFT